MSYEGLSGHQMESGYRSSAEFQDLVYDALPYSDEAWVVLQALIHHFRRSPMAHLDDLDVLELGCGTGKHMESFYNAGFKLHLLDDSPYQLAIAQRRFENIARNRLGYWRPPRDERLDTGVSLYEQNMITFKLDMQFDAIVCLGSIGNCLNMNELQQCLTNAAEHLLPGGIFIANGSWASGLTRAKPRYYEDRRVAVLRTGRNHRVGRVVNVTHQYLTDVGVNEAAGEGIAFFEETFSFALYADEEYVAAIRAAGLVIDGPVRAHPFKTPLFIGRKPVDHSEMVA